MKTVFSNINEVIHAFAQRPNDSTAYGRCNANVYFEGGTLYSYGRHYALAYWIGEGVVMINDTGYSNTTAKHISKAFHALSQYAIFRVTQCYTERVENTLKNLRNKLAKARKPEIYINEAKALFSAYSAYLEYLGKNTPEVISTLMSFFEGGDIEAKLNAYRLAEQKKRDEAVTKYRQAFQNYEPYEQYRNAAGLGFSLIRFKQNDTTTVETSQGVTM